MSILHIFKSTGKTFYEPYIELINENFDAKQHYFLIEDYSKNEKKANFRSNVEYIKKVQYIKLVKKMYTSDKIVLHSLLSPKLLLILFLQPWILKKCYWAIWGSDLYYYRDRKKNKKTDIYEYARKCVIKNIGGLITQIKGDYELAQKWYGAKGKYFYSFLYPSNLYKEHKYEKQNRKNNKIFIQIGNSADPANNHIEVFEKLKKYKDSDIKVVCPLSYGNKEYSRFIVREGKELFGENFNPLLEILPIEKYIKLLYDTDIAFFNHKRQQAMGNIITLIGLGKKVYIRNDITTWQFCLDHELKVFSINDESDDLFEELDDETRQKNINNMKSQFSEERLVEDWKKIFSEEV